MRNHLQTGPYCELCLLSPGQLLLALRRWRGVAQFCIVPVRICIVCLTLPPLVWRRALPLVSGSSAG